MEEHGIKEETALDLLGRLQVRKNLSGLQPALFGDGPLCKETIELVGEPSSGKTHILTDLVKKAILPAKFNEFVVGGLEVGVVYFSFDQGFDVFKLVALMVDHLNNYVVGVEPERRDSFNEYVVKDALQRLSVVDIFDSDSFALTLMRLKEKLCESSNVSLIVIDNVSTFYWQDRAMQRPVKMDDYVSGTLALVRDSLGIFPLTLIFSRPLAFRTSSTIQEPVLSERRNLGEVNRSIYLRHRNSDDGEIVRFAEVFSPTCTSVVFYEITKSSVRWYR